jgi:hypothetical protein
VEGKCFDLFVKKIISIILYDVLQWKIIWSLNFTYKTVGTTQYVSWDKFPVGHVSRPESVGDTALCVVISRETDIGGGIFGGDDGDVVEMIMLTCGKHLCKMC